MLFGYEKTNGSATMKFYTNIKRQDFCEEFAFKF